MLGSISAETFPVIDFTRTIQRYPEDFHFARQLEAETRPFLYTNTAKIFFSMVSIRTPVIWSSSTAEGHHSSHHPTPFLSSTFSPGESTQGFEVWWPLESDQAESLRPKG